MLPHFVSAELPDCTGTASCAQIGSSDPWVAFLWPRWTPSLASSFGVLEIPGKSFQVLRLWQVWFSDDFTKNLPFILRGWKDNLWREWWDQHLLGWLWVFTHQGCVLLGPSKYSCILSANLALPVAQEVNCGQRSQIESLQSLHRYFLSEADYRSGWSCLFACDTKDLNLETLGKSEKKAEKDWWRVPPFDMREPSNLYGSEADFVFACFCRLAHEWLDDCSRKSTST